MKEYIWTINDEDGELKLTLMATLAQNESKKTSQRVKAGQKISFENGVFYGNGNILGYDKIGKKMIVNEEQAETIKFIFLSFLKGLGTTEIKYELEKRGYLTVTGLKNWSASSIIRILQNPFYCGIIVYRKSYIPDYLEQKAKKNKGQVEQVIVEGTHQALISKEDFEKVQKIISTHSMDISEDKKKGCAYPKTIWSKKLICNCGSSFNRASYCKDKYGETKKYAYQCYNQKNMGSLNTRLKRGLSIEGACDMGIIQEWKLNLMFYTIFNTIWKDKEKIVDMANELIERTIAQEDYNSELELEMKNNKSKIETYNKKQNKLLDMFLSEMINKEEFATKKAEIEECVEKLKKRNNELEAQQGIPIDIFKMKLKSIKQSIIKNLYFEDKNISDEIIDNVVEYIQVRKDKFEWKLKYLNDTINLRVDGRASNPSVNLYENTPTETSSTGCY